MPQNFILGPNTCRHCKNAAAGTAWKKLVKNKKLRCCNADLCGRGPRLFSTCDREKPRTLDSRSALRPLILLGIVCKGMPSPAAPRIHPFLTRLNANGQEAHHRARSFSELPIGNGRRARPTGPSAPAPPSSTRRRCRWPRATQTGVEKPLKEESGARLRASRAGSRRSALR